MLDLVHVCSLYLPCPERMRVQAGYSKKQSTHWALRVEYADPRNSKAATLLAPVTLTLIHGPLPYCGYGLFRRPAGGVLPLGKLRFNGK